MTSTVNKLNNIFEEVDRLEPSSLNVCVNCGAQLESEYATHCNICGYDSAEAFSCPYQVKASVQGQELVFCELTRKQCKVEALDFEICPTFRSLDLIKNKE